MADDSREISDHEMQRRVLYSLLLPAVRLARVFRVPLKELVELLQMATFHELRSNGLSLDEIAARLDISMRTTARLSKRLKTNFFAPEREHELPRQIEFMLWAEPMSTARIKRELRGVSKAAIVEALAQLAREGRIVEQRGRVTTYAVTRGSERLVRPAWQSRIGALNSLASNVSAVVYGRLFAASPKSFARTLTLRVRPEDLSKLAEIYEEGVWKPLEGLDEAAAGQEATSMNVSICWAEYDSVP